MNHRLRNSYIGMQGMPLLLHRRLSMVWVSHFCGSTRTLGKNAWAGSRNYLTREVVRGGRGQPVERSGCFVDEWKLGNVPSVPAFQDAGGGCDSGSASGDFVFTRDDGRLVKDFRDAWWAACIRSGLGRFQCRECGQIVSEGRKCSMCHSKKKAKYFGLHFHDLRRTGIRNMSRKGIPEKVGMLISGHKTDSVYRRYNIIDMEVMKRATAKIEEHQREVVKAENSHRTATIGTKNDADDKTKRLN